MFHRSNQSYLTLILIVALSIGWSVTSDASKPVDYSGDVLPILETHCIGCHTADDAEGGLVMESFDGLNRGGKSGPR